MSIPYPATAPAAAKIPNEIVKSNHCSTITHSQFFISRHSLDLHLALQRGGFVGAGFAIEEFYRGAASGVFGAFARIVRGEAFVEVVGDAAIEGLVGALQEVAGPGVVL